MVWFVNFCLIQLCIGNITDFLWLDKVFAKSDVLERICLMKYFAERFVVGGLVQVAITN